MAKPIKEFRAGTCRASIFENQREKDGQKFTVETIQVLRSYRNGDGEWKDTSSYGRNDLPNLQAVIRAAFDFLALKERNPNGEK